MAGGFGPKGLALLLLCAMTNDEDRMRYFRAVCDKFSEKSVRLKLIELFERGYLERPDVSSLTERGRQALEAQRA